MSRSKHKSSGDIAGTTVVFKVLYCKVKNVLFFVLGFYVLCEKYYKCITVQDHVADYVSWVPKLTLLDLTNKLNSLRMEFVSG